MPKVSATLFKARCLELMDRVAERREAWVVTKRGKPVARLVPIARASKEPFFGRLAGQAEELGDITKPVAPASAWSAARRPARRRQK